MTTLEDVFAVFFRSPAFKLSLLLSMMISQIANCSAAACNDVVTAGAYTLYNHANRPPFGNASGPTPVTGVGPGCSHTSGSAQYISTGMFPSTITPIWPARAVNVVLCALNSSA
jgi:hypothetical protein